MNAIFLKPLSLRALRKLKGFRKMAQVLHLERHSFIRFYAYECGHPKAFSGKRT